MIVFLHLVTLAGLIRFWSFIYLFAVQLSLVWLQPSQEPGKERSGAGSTVEPGELWIWTERLQLMEFIKVRQHVGLEGVDDFVDTLSSAYVEDPVFQFTVGHDANDSGKRLRTLFLAYLQFTLSKSDGQAIVHVSEDGKCVAQWFHNDNWKFSALDQARMLTTLVPCFRWRTYTFMQIVNAMSAAHPTQPHMYLWVNGTEKSRQGMGLGSKVISVVLERCDREGLPAYLESSNPRNRPFYERHGFSVMHEITGLPEGCPPIVGMWRRPKTALSARTWLFPRSFFFHFVRNIFLRLPLLSGLASPSFLFFFLTIVFRPFFFFKLGSTVPLLGTLNAPTFCNNKWDTSIVIVLHHPCINQCVPVFICDPVHIVLRDLVLIVYPVLLFLSLTALIIVIF